MKKRIGLVLLLLLVATLLCSCLVTGGGDNVEAKLNTVVNPGGAYDYAALRDALKNIHGTWPSLVRDDSEPAEREIVIGPSNRPITAEAKAYLEGKLDSADMLDKWDASGYVIYATGGSVAVYWLDEYFAQEAIDRLTALISSGGGELEDGCVEIEYGSLIEFKEAEEAILREEQLDAVEAVYGAGVRDALAAYVEMIDNDDFYIWIAELYDPGTYDENGNPKGGGFYYSNSARATAGFLPDIESTRFAMSIVSGSGMFSERGSAYGSLSDSMKAELIAFARSLQSPTDGYFYHPQWGTNVTMGRLSRDLSNSITVLSSLGAKPLYNTPTGQQGELGAPGTSATSVTAGLTSGTVAAVSKVVATAGTSWPSHLETLSDFDSYLATFEPKIRTNSYSIGHTLAQQAELIKSRDRQGLESGEFVDADGDKVADGGFAEAYGAFFDRLQLENGLWEEGTLEDGTITYDAINGLMKISNGYEGLGLTMPRAEEAMRAALFVALLPGADAKGVTPSEVVKVYNPLISINNTLALFEDDPDTYATLKSLVTDSAEELIKVTSAKLLPFRKDDGSYGYCIGKNMPTSQGCSAAVAGIDEGDLNGAALAFNSTRRELFNMLDIDVDIFFDSDADKFLHALDGIEPIIKDEVIFEQKPIDFENYDVNETFIDELTFNLENGSAEVVNDSTHGKVMKFTDASTGSYKNSFSTSVGGKATGSCFRYEMDVMFSELDECAATTMFRLTLSNSYRLTGTYKNGKVRLGDINESGNLKTDLGIDLEPDVWYSLAVEYFPGGADSTYITIYVDGELRAVSTNFYKKTADGTAAASTSTKTLQFYSFFPVRYAVYVDNILAERTSAVYAPEQLPDSGDGEPEEESYGYFDFDGLELGATEIPGTELRVRDGEGNSMAVAEDPIYPGNNAIRIETTPIDGGANNQLLLSSGSGTGNCYVFETYMYLQECTTTSAIVQFSLCNSSNSNIMSINYYMSTDGLVKLQVRNVGSQTVTVAENIFPDNEWYSFRIEYYVGVETADGTVNIAKFFIDEEYVCEAETLYNEANKNAPLGSVKIQPLAAADIVLYLDDIILDTVEKDYVEGEVEPG